jgi:hypothetical protein
MLDEVELLLQRKLEAPLAVNVTRSPAQIETFEALMFTTGIAFTTMVAFAVFEHPLTSVPVTA